VSPDNPVVLRHASGHATFANAKAMELAGITRNTPNPPGGDILKDEQANPIGVFRENASGLLGKISAALPQPTPEEREARARREIELAAEECLRNGVTSVHDAGAGADTINRYKKMIDEGRLGVRVYAMLQGSNRSFAKDLASRRIIDYGNAHLTVRSIKKLIDGALGPRTAWLLAPYADLPTSTGIETDTLADISETARLAIENGFQLNVHAIGDRANRETLNIYEAAFKAHPDGRDLRWRIEHAQHISAADIPRFGQLGVIASMQAIHCTSDAPYVLMRLGPQRAEEGAYVWRKLMKTGAVIANGTDAPVEYVDTTAGFYAFVTRKMKSGESFFPDQKMSRAEALKAYTLNGAYAAFEESSKGSLAPGKLADIAVLSKDIMTIPDQEILTTECSHVVGGRWRKEAVGATGRKGRRARRRCLPGLLAPLPCQPHLPLWLEAAHRCGIDLHLRFRSGRACPAVRRGTATPLRASGSRGARGAPRRRPPASRRTGVSFGRQSRKWQPPASAAMSGTRCRAPRRPQSCSSLRPGCR
jgi:predicted amidohydrolase YtcJ